MNIFNILCYKDIKQLELEEQQNIVKLKENWMKLRHVAPPRECIRRQCLRY